MVWTNGRRVGQAAGDLDVGGRGRRSQAAHTLLATDGDDLGRVARLAEPCHRVVRRVLGRGLVEAVALESQDDAGGWSPRQCRLGRCRNDLIENVNVQHIGSETARVARPRGLLGVAPQSSEYAHPVAAALDQGAARHLQLESIAGSVLEEGRGCRSPENRSREPTRSARCRCNKRPGSWRQCLC